ncbi:MAG: pilus assembly protein N-terminal domain-containing protein [Deltaproteobacteria bacterium]|nr:pilus assembly protein N-terminal domain-containing protein [Deltaproteobacteria bacterium]
MAEEGGNISIAVGQQRVLTVKGITRISIGDDSIAAVKAIAATNQVLITGVKKGRTTLIVWRSSGQRVSYLVNVTMVPASEVIREVQALLGSIEGVTIRTVGDRVYLDGSAYTTEDFQRINEVTELYPSVKSFVKVAPNAKKLVANTLNQELQRAGLKNVQASVVGTTIFLEGSVESQQDLQKAELITKAVGERVENLLVVGIKRMILTEVQFVEIRKKGTDNIGVAWPLDINGSVTYNIDVAQPFQAGSSVGWVNTNPDYKATWGGGLEASSPFAFGLNLSDGYGRLLAQPKLVCASGEKAEFLAGGEVPIPMITANEMSVEYKEFGVKLEIQPTADRHGNIQTQIYAEVSEVDDSVSVKVGANINIPGFRNRHVKTNVTVRHGETIVLSGVFNHDQQKSVAKFPLLGHIPILGELFKSRKFQETKSELVIFVIPRIVNPDTERIRKTIADIKTRYKQARRQVNFSIFD